MNKIRKSLPSQNLNFREFRHVKNDKMGIAKGNTKKKMLWEPNGNHCQKENIRKYSVEGKTEHLKGTVSIVGSYSRES